MDKICAVVDAQGFYIRNQFLAREVAFVSDTLSHCQEFNPNIKWGELNLKESKTVRVTRARVHGFSLNAYRNKLNIVPESSLMIHYIQQFHKLLASEEKPYFGVKNIKLKEVLENAGIPVCDLGLPEFGMPSVTKIEKMYNSDWICAYHTEADAQRCALRKCYNLWRYIKTRLYEETNDNPVAIETLNDAHQSN